MAGSKEIRNKIKSVQSTRKITKAMEMVAASKMKKAQDRMRAARPYVGRMVAIVRHLAHANTEYRHPFLLKRPEVKSVGLIVVTSDKGLCGGLNTNALRLALSKIKAWQAKGVACQVTAIGNKGLGFMQRLKANIVSQVINLGDRPHLDKIIGPVKVQLDAVPRRQDRRVAHRGDAIRKHDEADAGRRAGAADRRISAKKPKSARYPWDYIYEPDAKTRARRAADALHRVDHLSGGQREHGVRAERAHGGDEVRVGKRGDHHR